MIDNKRFIEAVVGGIFFGSVYFLCKFKVALEMDGSQVDPTSMLGQFFWFAKIFLGVLASKVAGQEMVSLIEKTWPMVQSAVIAQADIERRQVAAKNAEERGTTAAASTTEQQAPGVEPEPTPRERRTSGNVQAYPADDISMD